MGILIRDPVCGMQVESEQYTIEYLQMHYAFCSRQRQEHFLENLHLYVGLPGQKAPRQEGHEVIKQRRLHRSFVHYEDECEAGNLEVHEKSGVHRHHH